MGDGASAAGAGGAASVGADVVTSQALNRPAGLPEADK